MGDFCSAITCYEQLDNGVALLFQLDREELQSGDRGRSVTVAPSALGGGDRGASTAADRQLPLLEVRSAGEEVLQDVVRQKNLAARYDRQRRHFPSIYFYQIFYLTTNKDNREIGKRRLRLRAAIISCPLSTEKLVTMQKSRTKYSLLI